jgi:hypothetical protein
MSSPFQKLAVADANRRRARHGQTGSPEYIAWTAMRQRCKNGKYQGRFAVCERWQTFENFLADMGPKPSSKHSLERSNNSKGYNPENCVWATPTEQSSNTKATKRVILGGETVTLAEYARRTGIPYGTVYEHYNKGKLHNAD